MSGRREKARFMREEEEAIVDFRAGDSKKIESNESEANSKLRHFLDDDANLNNVDKLREYVKEDVSSAAKEQGLTDANNLINETTERIVEEIKTESDGGKNETSRLDVKEPDSGFEQRKHNAEETHEHSKEEGEATKKESEQGMLNQETALDRNKKEGENEYNIKMLEIKLEDKGTPAQEFADMSFADLSQTQEGKELNDAVKQMYADKGIEAPGDDENVMQYLSKSIGNGDISWDDIDALTISNKEKDKE